MNTQDIRRLIDDTATMIGTAATTTAARFVAAVALVLALPPAALSAQAPTVYFACYVPSSGTVYRIKEPDTPQECGASSKKGGQVQHIAFSWTDGAGAVRVTDPAAGDLSGPLGSPAVARLLGRALSTTPPTDGQVLTWNQVANEWQAKAAPSAGGVDHGALTGLGDDDHTQYLLANGVRNSANGFAVTGTVGVGSIPTSGTGARLMWYPNKAAFRAGYAALSEWDDSNIGLYSVGLGYQARASGYGGAAVGSFVQAAGQYSFAARSGVAIGFGSAAIGGVAAGDRSTAIGSGVTASGDRSLALGYQASTNGKAGAFVYGDASPLDFSSVSAIADNQFVVRAARFWLGADNNVTATAGRYIETSTGAFLSSGGTWTNSSDSTRKTAFREIDGDALLAKLASMPVRTWSYRAEDSTVRHMGPTAQEFRAAFSLGDSDKAIATVDADGVSLAAIQALVRRADRLTRDNDTLRRTSMELRSELRALEERTALLEAQLAQLVARLSDADVRR